MKNLLIIVIWLVCACSAGNTEFVERARGVTGNQDLITICRYLDTVQSISDSIGYETMPKEDKVIIISGRYGLPGGFQFPAPSRLYETMIGLDIKRIVRVRSQECVLVIFSGNVSMQSEEYLVFHSMSLEKCAYFEEKTESSDATNWYGYTRLDSCWTASVEKR